MASILLDSVLRFYKNCNIEGQNTMSYVARELSQRNKLLFGLGSF